MDNYKKIQDGLGTNMANDEQLHPSLRIQPLHHNELERLFKWYGAAKLIAAIKMIEERLNRHMDINPVSKPNNEQTQPWKQIGISRATWYRDQKRSKES